MLAYTRPMRLLVAVIAPVVAACGQTGSLYLPDETIESPVEIRTTTDDEDKKEEKTAEPPGR
jgi:predicted small lipoprotein YifL